jgi:hypothetical protein
MELGLDGHIETYARTRNRRNGAQMSFGPLSCPEASVAAHPFELNENAQSWLGAAKPFLAGISFEISKRAWMERPGGGNP